MAMRVAASRGATPVWRAWRAWRDRFGLAEVCGSIAAITGFTAGYRLAGSLLSAAVLATGCEVIAFYGCVGARTAIAAAQATAHLTGRRRLAAAAWHAVRDQLASCAAAEAVDDLLVRPGCLAGAAWLLRPLPGGVWLGFALGKAAADVAWYALEASARWGVSHSAAGPGGRAVSPRHDVSATGGAPGRAPEPGDSVGPFTAGETGYAEERLGGPGPAGGCAERGHPAASPPALSSAR